uniref:Coiled-coil SMC6 And NSE5 INteracting (CANIN) domain-containing protein n=1 Tax=Gadus morhua TaxID=8049 RepID=A0A8C5FSE8_GADMO
MVSVLIDLNCIYHNALRWTLAGEPATCTRREKGPNYTEHLPGLTYIWGIITVYVFCNINMSENQGNPRTMSEYYSPTGKVKDYLGCPMQQYSPSQLPYFQESPMKPSQVQNRLSLSVQKRMSPRQSHKSLTPANTRTIDSLSSPKVAKPAENFQNNAFRVQKQTAQTSSSLKLHPARSNCSLLKRCSDSEVIDSSLKKPCLQNSIPGPVQNPKCVASQSQCLSALSSSSPSALIRLELSPEKTNTNLAKEAASSPSVHSMMLPQLNPPSSPDSDIMPPSNSPGLPGVRKAHMVKVTEDYVYLRSPIKSSFEQRLRMLIQTKNREGVRSPCHRLRRENNSATVQDSKDSSINSSGRLESHQIGCSQQTIPPQVKLPCKDEKSGESTTEEIGDVCRAPKQTSKSTSTGPLGGNTGQNKSMSRRASVILDDIADLFTPDPLIYVSNPKHKAVVLSTAEQEKLGPNSTEGDCVPDSAEAASCTPSAESPSQQKQHSTGTNCARLTGSVNVKDAKYTSCPKLPILVIQLERLNMDLPLNSISLAGGLKLPVSLPNKQLNKHNSEPVEVHKTPLNPENRTSATGEALPAVEGSSSKDPSSSARPSTKEDADHGGTIVVKDDEEPGFDLFFGVDPDEAQSSEEEPIPTMKEMLQIAAEQPDMPEKKALPKPPSPIYAPTPSTQLRTIPSRMRRRALKSTSKALGCRNNLDQMLMDIRSIKRSKDQETVLLSCIDDDFRKAEYGEDEEAYYGAIPSDQQEFVQRFPVVSSSIKDVHPGEVVFDLDTCGRLFSQHTLQLRHCKSDPQGTTQKTLLWSSPAQLNLHIRIGMFQDAFDFSPCPPKVTRFLFKMMSVHTERMISDKILQALCVIARSAANHIVKTGSQKFEVWVPSVADVTLVLLNMGASFVTLFPLERLQPPFSEGDLLADKDISSESPSDPKKRSTFPKHNYSNVFKYLSYCMDLCPRAFSDPELLLLLAVSCRLGLEVHFALEPHIDLRCLQRHILSNVRDWENMLPRMCLAVTELTADHHNMCCLVQLLPDHARGKQLRRHLSVCMISKLLDGSCTYKPSVKEFQLSYLLPYLSRMKPSSLRSRMLSDMDTIDQQEQLLELCYELDRHIKRDMNENDKCLYRNRVNDLVARIYTTWLKLIQRIRPLNDQLFDFWKPSPQEMLSSSSVETKEMSEEEDEEEEGSDAPDQPGLSIDREEEVDEDMDEGEPTGAMENDKEPEQMKGPAGGEVFTAVVMEHS